MRRFVPKQASGESCRPVRSLPGGRIGKGLVLPDESPRHIAECRERRGLSPAMEDGCSVGALTPEANAFRVFRPAPPARVETRNGSPVQIAFSCFRGRVTAASGPWRSSGEWWREDSYDKDEWDLEIQPNPKEGRSKRSGVYRVCFDRTKKAWFVLGAFD